MVHELEVPFALSGFQIDTDDALGEEVVAWTMAAIVVGRRRFNWEVDEAGLLVDGDLRPHAGVAGLGPRLVLPRVVAEFAWPRNRVERPQQLAAAHIERAHQALGVVVGVDG